MKNERRKGRKKNKKLKIKSCGTKIRKVKIQTNPEDEIMTEMNEESKTNLRPEKSREEEALEEEEVIQKRKIQVVRLKPRRRSKMSKG